METRRSGLRRDWADLVHDNDIDPALPDRLKRRLKRRTLQARTGKAAIAETGPYQAPSFMSLALDIGRAGFALGVGGIEVLLEAMIGRDADVDRASTRGLRRG